jgi:hypothetical protein
MCVAAGLRMPRKQRFKPSRKPPVAPQPTKPGGEPVQSGPENRPDSVEIEREVSARPSGFATGGSVDNRDDDHSR